MPSVRYQGALTAALWRSSHHCPFKEVGEAEIVCGLPEVLQLVSRAGTRAPLSGAHPCTNEAPHPAAPKSWCLWLSTWWICLSLEMTSPHLWMFVCLSLLPPLCVPI